jgi:PsbN protein
METSTIIVIFLTSLFIGITGYSIHTAFGPGSKNLRDPFEEHES